MAYLDLTCRTALWAVLLTAAAGKARPNAYRGFVSSLASLRWLPARLAASTALAVIAVEATTVVALSAPPTAIAGYGLAAAALAAFSAAGAHALRRGDRLHCRCFGADAGPIGRPQLARNAGLIVIALVGLSARLGGGPGAAGWPGPVATAAAVASGLAIAVAVVRWDDLAYLLAPNPRRRVT